MADHEWREPSGRTVFPTVADRLFWSYANLAMAHAALKNAATAYGPFPYFQIRAKLFSGLQKATMKVGSLFDDERLKVLATASCAYCGAAAPNTIDHVVPRIRGGDDRGENLVPACRRCNSAKGGADVMAWHRSQRRFPSLAVTRRYLKLAMDGAGGAGLMQTSVTSITPDALPFDVSAIPMVYPKPPDLVWEARDRL